jgi:membrane protein implicated in regulation of membrane protease activity
MRQVIIIDPKDNVATAIKDLRAAERIDTQRGPVVLLEDIPFGHKVALEAIPEGELLVKYGAPIGRATMPIEPGEHVHIHNIEDITDKVRKGV